MSSLAEAFARIESSGNPLAWNTLPSGQRSRYRGLYQFGPDLERRYGITDWTNPDQQHRAFGQHIEGLRTGLTRRLGRAPTDGELYLAHQQGIAGGPALLTAPPGTSAWEAIRPFYGSDAMASQAITGNIPRGHALYGRDADEIGADEFARLWTSRFPSGNGMLPSAPAPVGSMAEYLRQPEQVPDVFGGDWSIGDQTPTSRQPPQTPPSVGSWQTTVQREAPPAQDAGIFGALARFEPEQPRANSTAMGLLAGLPPPTPMQAAGWLSNPLQQQRRPGMPRAQFGLT